MHLLVEPRVLVANIHSLKSLELLPLGAACYDGRVVHHHLPGEVRAVRLLEVSQRRAVLQMHGDATAQRCNSVTNVRTVGPMYNVMTNVRTSSGLPEDVRCPNETS